MQPDGDALIARQQQEIDTLRARIRELEDAMMPPLALPIEWGLTGSEAQVFSFLTTRELASKEQIMSALYGLRAGAEEVEPKIVDVFVCKIRKKLKPFGVNIETVWGRGYALADRHTWARAS